MNQLLPYIFILYATYSLLFMIKSTDAQEQKKEIKKINSRLVYNSEKFTKEENELWKLEETYIVNYLSSDSDTLSLFWHNSFIGWPSWSNEPVNKKNALSLISTKKDSTTKTIQIMPKKIIILDGIAVLHYIIDIFEENKIMEKSISSYRIIHTWIKQDNNWRILSGMSSKN